MTAQEIVAGLRAQQRVEWRDTAGRAHNRKPHATSIADLGRRRTRRRWAAWCRGVVR